MTSKYLSIRGAREHNLKNISIDIPKDQLVVITGLSGSGKSSLAFDTIYAEGQRRYVESLSAYARQFLQLMQKPDVDLIEGLSPAIAIEQKTTSKNPRSTVGTVTEIYDYLRLLFARVGVPHSPKTGLPIQSQNTTEIVTCIQKEFIERKIYILAPMIRGRKGEYKKEIQEWQRRGYTRLWLDGHVYLIEDVPELSKNKKHDISIIVDRLLVKPDMETRLTDTVETVLGLSDGLVIVWDVEEKKERLFSSKYACPVSGFALEEIEPRLFSFNSPFGACPSCDGLGVEALFDENLVVPNPSLSLQEGAIAPWSGTFSDYYLQTLQSVLDYYGEDITTPYKDLSTSVRYVLMQGSGTEIIPIKYQERQRVFSVNKPFEGVINFLKRRLKDAQREAVQEELEKYQSKVICPSCQGFRLKAEALCVKVDGKHIGQITDLSIEKCLKWIENLSEKLSPQSLQIADRILKEIRERLIFLISVGLEYLTLSRYAGTLSGGESQRIRLASQMGSGLTGVLYVLDEPSIGLHQRDNDRLLQTLQKLRDLGNTVLVVEHDEDAILQADYVIDMGPGAGLLGGEVVAQGAPEVIKSNIQSITGAYLSGRKEIKVPTKRRLFNQKKSLKLFGASLNNLKAVDVMFPLGAFIAITGVSGSGKSSLVIETLYKILKQHVYGTRQKPGPYKSIEGLEHIDKVIDIDQSPIGRTPRSNPATYTGLFGPIRDWFSQLPEAKARGYKPGRFSFNVKGGRCEACQGDGVIRIEMHFLPDVYVMCDTCKGKRYNKETLSITYKGKSIADILDMTVAEASEFFAGIPSLYRRLNTLERVGLSYIKVGQQATTLSGGEAQRVKLSKELSKRSTGKTVYILDEPTTGLHFEDINKLLEVLHTLVNQGNTLLVIEHNLDVIKTSDWVIDVGPEGGAKGGSILAVGTPEDIAKCPQSYTGRYLKSILNRHNLCAGS